VHGTIISRVWVRTREFTEVWRKYASNVVDTDAMQWGHHIPEEMPDHVHDRSVDFFKVWSFRCVPDAVHHFAPRGATCCTASGNEVR
jgi:hypothetical protein